MSGLSIDHGGAIAVDTAQLRDLAVRVRGVVPVLAEVADAVARAAPGATMSSSSTGGGTSNERRHSWNCSGPNSSRVCALSLPCRAP